MEKWPKDGSAVSFRRMGDPVRKAILFAYNIERKNRNRNIPWDGLDIGDAEKARCFSPNEQLKVKNLRYSEGEQSRDALDEIIGIAIQLGIEQGRRVFRNSTEYQLMKIRLDLHKKI
jgi:hypothetical protein